MPHDGQFLSCCAAVGGVTRNLFVVPRPDVLEAHADDIQAAQQEADADPTARGDLMKTLHVGLPSPARLLISFAPCRTLQGDLLSELRASYPVLWPACGVAPGNDSCFFTNVPIMTLSG